jgi:hypothetical protein
MQRKIVAMGRQVKKLTADGMAEPQIEERGKQCK